jgi:predicted transcriptional regulator
MKYKKGTFVIVPNLDELSGKPSEMQAIYLWICSHADKNGVCFPTKSKIGEEAGCSHNTVSKYLKQLVEDGFLEIKERYTKNGRNTSNEYQLLILEGIPPKNGIDHPTKNGSQTISRSNYTHLTINIDTKTLPLSRGNSPQKRLESIYCTMFYSKYGYKPNVVETPQRLKVIKELLVGYTELQLAFLLMVYFNWNGMNNDKPKEQEYLQSKSHSLYTFKYGIQQYELYTRNVSGFKKEFEESGDELLKVIGTHITNLTNNE